jgi:hypothetical protein
MVIDGLLHCLENHGLWTQGFADNVCKRFVKHRLKNCKNCVEIDVGVQLLSKKP